MFDYFLGVARRCGEQILDGKPVGAFKDRLLYRLGDMLVYAPLRNRMGFSRIRVAYTAGEAIGPELFRFYRSLGINLKQLYGRPKPASTSRCSRTARSIPTPSASRARTSRSRLPTAERCCSRARAYSSSTTRTTRRPADTKTPDGWVHTGDAGFFDQRGHLKIIDRAKDVGRLNSGALFAPKYLENRIKFYPEVREAVAFGHGRDYVTMLINIDLTSVGNWAERNNVSYASYQELAAHPQVYEMVAKRVDELNQRARRRAADGGLADPPLPDPAQGARCRRRRADAHAEGAPLLHRRSLRRR